MKRFIRSLICSIQENLSKHDYYGAFSSSVILFETCVKYDQPHPVKQDYLSWLDTQLLHELHPELILELYQIKCSLLEGARTDKSSVIPIVNHINDYDILMDTFTGTGVQHHFVDVSFFCQKIMTAAINWLGTEDKQRSEDYYGIARTLKYGDNKFLIVK